MYFIDFSDPPPSSGMELLYLSMVRIHIFMVNMQTGAKNGEYMTPNRTIRLQIL